MSFLESLAEALSAVSFESRDRRSRFGVIAVALGVMAVALLVMWAVS